MLKKIWIGMIFCLLLGAGSGIACGDIWINEIHYDNAGTDQDEGVEIVISPEDAGIDLSTIRVDFYNGNGGASYANSTFASPNTNNTVDGFQIVSILQSGIQNGAPDGIALSVNGTLIEFLSYEGSFTATDGIANGVTSTDIGVSEGSATPVGSSLQRAGSGFEITDFTTWDAPATATFGSANTNQTLAVPEPTLFGLSVFVAAGIGLRIRRRATV